MHTTFTGNVPDGTYPVQATWHWFGITGTTDFNLEMTGGTGTIHWGGNGGNGTDGAVSATFAKHPNSAAANYTVSGSAAWSYSAQAPGYGQTYDCYATGSITASSDHVAQVAIHSSGGCGATMTYTVSGGTGGAMTALSTSGYWGANVTGDHTGATVSAYANGTLVAQGTITGYTWTPSGSPEFPGGAYIAQMDMGSFTCPAPTPTPTPTPTPAPTPTPTPAPTPTPPPPTPPPFNTPPPTPPPHSTPYPSPASSGNVIVTNPEDIYGPIVEAVGKLGAGVPVSSAPAPAAEHALTDDTKDRGHIDELVDLNAANNTQVTEGIDSGKTIMNSVVGPIQGWSSVSFGSVTTLPLPLNMINPAWPSSVPVPGFASLIRTAILWIITICWWIAAIRSILALKVEA